eukprot:scaffold14277_cov69-Cyclotella_meneghiniana.AAC.1
MESLLTEGGVQQLIEAEGLFTNRHHPKLQVINIRRVPANALTDVRSYPTAKNPSRWSSPLSYRTSSRPLKLSSTQFYASTPINTT